MKSLLFWDKPLLASRAVTFGIQIHLLWKRKTQPKGVKGSKNKINSFISQAGKSPGGQNHWSKACWPLNFNVQFRGSCKPSGTWQSTRKQVNSAPEHVPNSDCPRTHLTSHTDPPPNSSWNGNSHLQLLSRQPAPARTSNAAWNLRRGGGRQVGVGPNWLTPRSLSLQLLA